MTPPKKRVHKKKSLKKRVHKKKSLKKEFHKKPDISKRTHNSNTRYRVCGIGVECLAKNNNSC
ncbi:hypothetical protein EDA74_02890 [Helicobacter pylori]|nr:hypothetical protein EDA74_02890 [Helicobacter pylori]